MQPFLALFLLPVLLGVAAGLVWRDTRHASLAAGFASALVVYFFLEFRDPDGTWNWLAAFLVAPLVIAFSLTAVFICHGRVHGRKHRPNGA